MTDILISCLQESLDSKKGITFYLQGGNTIGGGVVRIHDDFVEVKNQRSGKILILLDAIVAVELS